MLFIAWGPPLASWASCQIRKIAGAHAPGMPGTFSPPTWVSDPDMHHGTCVTHVPRCMPGSLTSGFLWGRWWGKTFPAFPVHAQHAMLRIWQEAHDAISAILSPYTAGAIRFGWVSHGRTTLHITKQIARNWYSLLLMHEDMSQPNG